MDPGIDVIESKVKGDTGFHFQVRATGARFRLVPARLPAQPRYWCFRVSRCMPGGLTDFADRPWFGAVGMTREELPAAAEAIRADVVAWLTLKANRELRRWVLAKEHAPRPSAAARRPAVRATAPVAALRVATVRAVARAGHETRKPS